jgi:hypothetical protein
MRLLNSDELVATMSQLAKRRVQRDCQWARRGALASEGVRNGSNCERSIGLQITVAVRITAVRKEKRSAGEGIWKKRSAVEKMRVWRGTMSESSENE